LAAWLSGKDVARISVLAAALCVELTGSLPVLRLRTVLTFNAYVALMMQKPSWGLFTPQLGFCIIRSGVGLSRFLTFPEYDL